MNIFSLTLDNQFHILKFLDERPLTMDEIVAQCFAFFLAGFETSSSTVTFALFELSRNAEVQEKVQAELQKVLSKYDNKICYDALKELEYMQQVIDGKYKSVVKLFTWVMLLTIKNVFPQYHKSLHNKISLK